MLLNPNSLDPRNPHRCQTCGQHVQAYRRSINSTMARWLIAAVKRYVRHPGGWLSVADDWSLSICRGTGDIAKLRYWGLIESPPPGSDADVRSGKKAAPGLWSPTSHGIEFANGRLRVRRFAVVYDGELLRLEGEPVGIRDALGKDFHYEQLMRGEG